MVWRDDVRSALERLGGIGSLGQIYEEVEANKVKALPNSWQAIVRRELEYNSSDSESYKGKHNLFYSVRGIGAGLWGLRKIASIAPDAADIAQPAGRIETHTYRILRDTLMARRVKQLHGNSCQLCGQALQLSGDVTYSEAHHIQPLGPPHNGPDIEANIIVVCPNHHALLDYGAIQLDFHRIRDPHVRKIGEEFIRYHNGKVVRSPVFVVSDIVVEAK